MIFIDKMVNPFYVDYEKKATSPALRATSSSALRFGNRHAASLWSALDGPKRAYEERLKALFVGEAYR